MNETSNLSIDWLYKLKRKILLSILLVLTMTIVTTMGFIAFKLRTTLVEDSKSKTQELAVTISANLQELMILNSPEAIQQTLETLASKNTTIEDVFILDNNGQIAYSSQKADIGLVLSQSDPSCIVCHGSDLEHVKTDDIVLETNGKTHRNISLIINEASCHDCHDPEQSINGKLIIDRDLENTFSLITMIQLILFGSGLVCLIVLIPLFSKVLSKGINKYIFEIFTRNEELRLLYVMVERLSKTLDMDLLKEIVIEIFKDVLDAEEVEIVLARGDQEYSASKWSSATGKVERIKIVPGNTESLYLQNWLEGKLDDTEINEKDGVICMPIKKGAHRLAMIIAKKEHGNFDKDRLKLCKVINSHIAVAFDNARLYYIAITDELTKTFTKRHFRNCIDDIFADHQHYGHKFALLMMDLDKFKQVNDNYGHVAGDSVLQTLGKIITQSLRENDLAFRYGGEEFAIILPGTDAKGAQFVAERIRAAVENHVFEPGTLDLKLTISIGVATCPDAPTPRELIIAADEALYKAKAEGRNRVVLSEKIFDTIVQEPWAP